MDYALKAQLRAVVGIASPATVDLAGQVQVGSTATFWARIEPRYREVDVNGVIEKTSHFIVLDETTAASISEFQFRSVQIFLPADPTVARRPRQTHYCYGEFGELDHIEVYV